MKRLALAAMTSALALLTTNEAAARLTIRDGSPPEYALEIEPHLDVEGLDADGTLFGLGAGIRFSIPIVRNGFIPKINDSVAITFGGDFVRFPSGATICGANACVDSPGYSVFYAPVAMQWNFFLTDQWSVFGEPGIALRHSFADNPGADPGSLNGNDRPRVVVAFGGRYRLSSGMTLTMRVGLPVLASVGLSFF
jgi:hypothetical protein